MAATLDDLNARKDKLKSALASGVMSIEYDGRRIQYRSVNDIRAAIGAVEQDIALLNGTAVVRSYKLTSSKDL